MKLPFSVERIVNRLLPLNSLHSKEDKVPRPRSIRKLLYGKHLERGTIPPNPSQRVLSSPKFLGKSNVYIIFNPAEKSSVFTPPPPREPYRVKYGTARQMMHSYIQFITTPTADTPGTTLFLQVKDQRYLLGNMSEGTQRACVQRKFGMSKIDDLFVTGKVNWATAGGILGTILTLADVHTNRADSLKENAMYRNKKQTKKSPESLLRLHGGRNLTYLLATARRFVFRKGMPLYTHEIREKNLDGQEWSPVWSDHNIKVWSMVVSPTAPSPTPQKSPRKRSSDEISDDAERAVDLNGAVVRETKEEQENRYDQMIDEVVKHMFSSTWKLDALTKVRLPEVKTDASIFVRDDEGKIKKYDGPMPGTGQPVPDIEVLTRSPWPASSIPFLPPTKPSQDVLSYFVRGNDQRGKFDPSKADALGVKGGPDRGKLTHGQNVVGKDGTTVTPDMVMGPDQPGGGFAIIEIPSNEYIEPTLDREEWSVKDVTQGIDGVVWILGSGVKVQGRLQKFMVEHSEWDHIVSSPDYCSNYLALESVAASAIRLHQIAPDNFPVPVHKNTSTVQWEAEDSNSTRPFQPARIGQMMGIFPAAGIQNESVIQYLDTKAVVNEASPELLELAESARKQVSDPAFLAKLEEHQKDIPSKDAEVIALGTGSSLPSKYRNVSATLIRVPGYGNYLLDCGENTVAQLKRVFGPELPDVLRNLKMIWISHLHADHHMGTASVIREWHRLTEHSEQHQKERLLVASDIDMLKWLEEYSRMEDYGYDRIEPLALSVENKLSNEFSPDKVKDWGLSSIVACKVSHCHGALAVVLNFPNGLKVAYSGDCRPSNDFVRIGQGATLLIHEATFDDELQGDAIAKKHSTTSEAIDIGRRMKARRILLTHFSQRYQKLPAMSEEGGDEDIKAGVCFDYMKVKIGDIAKLEAFRPALLKLFEEKDPDEESLEEAPEPALATSSKATRPVKKYGRKGAKKSE